MEKLKSLGSSIIERAKTDKKFLGALIGGAVAVVAIIVALIVALSGGSSSQGGGGNTDSGSGEKPLTQLAYRQREE